MCAFRCRGFPSIPVWLGMHYNLPRAVPKFKYTLGECCSRLFMNFVGSWTDLVYLQINNLFMNKLIHLSQLRLFINELELMNWLMLFLTIHCRLEHLHFIIYKHAFVGVVARISKKKDLFSQQNIKKLAVATKNEVRIRCRNKSVMRAHCRSENEVRARCRDGNEACCPQTKVPNLMQISKKKMQTKMQNAMQCNSARFEKRHQSTTDELCENERFVLKRTSLLLFVNRLTCFMNQKKKKKKKFSSVST